MSNKFEEVIEEVKFLTLGKKRVKKQATSYVIEQGETVEGLVTEIKDSKMYTKIYTLKVKDCEVPVVITGKRDLLEKFGFGTLDVIPLKTGDEVKITWDGTYETKNGTGFKFSVQVARC